MRERVYEIRVGGFASDKTRYVSAMSLMRVVNSCIDKYRLRYGYLKPHDMPSVNALDKITVHDDKKRCFIQEVKDGEAIGKLIKKGKLVPISEFA